MKKTGIMFLVLIAAVCVVTSSNQVHATPMMTPYPTTLMVTVFYTPTKTPTITKTPTATAIPPDPEQCIQVVWDKGTAAKGLNLRNGAHMGSNADGRSYLGPGFIFKPLAYRTTIQGQWAKVAEPDWWIALSLWYRPQDVYTVEVDCP